MLVGRSCGVGRIRRLGVIVPILFWRRMGRLDPFYRHFPIEYSPVLHLWRGLHLALVKPFRGEPHDLVLHAILRLQECHTFGFVLHDALHEGLTESRFQRGDALHGGWQLAMVAGKHHP